jgi:hypothetical protein
LTSIATSRISRMAQIHWAKRVNVMIRLQLEPRLWIHCALYPLQLRVIIICYKGKLFYLLAIFSMLLCKYTRALRYSRLPRSAPLKSVDAVPHKERSHLGKHEGCHSCRLYSRCRIYWRKYTQDSLFTTSKRVTFAFELIHEASNGILMPRVWLTKIDICFLWKVTILI